MRLFSILAIIVLAVSSTSSVQAQDNCIGAIAIGDGLTPGTNVGSSSGPDPIGACGAMGNDVSYAYTASCNGIAVATFCAPGIASYDSVLAAWSGTCGALVPLACNDDFCGLSSQITFGVTSGTIYYLSVGGFGGSVGTFTLSMSCAGAVANDSCATALGITEGVPTSGTNLGSSTGPDPIVTTCGFGNANDVWFVVVPTCSGLYGATTCDPGTGFDTVLGIWSGACGSLVAVACNDDDPTGCTTGGYFGLESRLTWAATAGTPYYISVAGYNGNTGNFTLLVTNGAGMTLSFINSGPGTIGYQVGGGSPNGQAFTAVTLNLGTYPNGWFFGIDPSAFTELIYEYTLGFPFITGLDACGSATVGPFPGVPSGLNLYGVSVVLPLGGAGPVTSSAPATGTVP